MKGVVTALFLSFMLPITAHANETNDTAVAKEVATHLSKHEFEAIRDNFNDQMKAALSADKMKEVWDGLIAVAGDFKKISSTQYSKATGFSVVRVRCACEDMPIIVKVLFDDAGKIGGLWVLPASAPNQ